ncbi:DUF305 domain-containing protein [Phyllobacterium sp.]
MKDMSHRYLNGQRALLLAGTLAVAWSAIAAARDPSSDVICMSDATKSAMQNETPFLTQNDAAMAKMMADMEVKPTGDVDRDFVAMMVPHHQGAIDMALAVLRYGNNENIKRLAQEIIVTQQQEIAAMRLAIGEPLPPSKPSPTQTSFIPDLDTHSPTTQAMSMSPAMNMK